MCFRFNGTLDSLALLTASLGAQGGPADRPLLDEAAATPGRYQTVRVRWRFPCNGSASTRYVVVAANDTLYAFAKR